jgi:hypothetical protein
MSVGTCDPMVEDGRSVEAPLRRSTAIDCDRMTRGIAPAISWVVTVATCNGCGAHVTGRFIRVFAPSDGDLEGCPRCMTNSELFGGGTNTAGDANGERYSEGLE